MLQDTRPPRGSGGGAAPWRDEPNRVAWRDTATGLQCLILRSAMGNLCGYVRVPRDHPMHGLRGPYLRRGLYGLHRQTQRLRVHGGITFAGCIGGRVMKRGYWFGFDCAHWQDLVPGMLELRKTLPPSLDAELFQHNRPEVYRDVGYVRGQCTDLAEQLARKGSR